MLDSVARVQCLEIMGARLESIPRRAREAAVLVDGNIGSMPRTKNVERKGASGGGVVVSSKLKGDEP
jgi:hypothetical protein